MNDPADEAAVAPDTAGSVVTVVVPTLNGARYLDENLTAVLGQRLPAPLRLEVLVIDSGSTDRTLEILDRFADRIRLHRITREEFSHGGTRDAGAEHRFLAHLS